MTKDEGDEKQEATETEDEGSEPDVLNEKFTITVRDIVSKNETTVIVNNFDTIADMKRKVRENVGLDVNDFSLFFNGKMLKRKYNCYDYMIKPNALVYLKVRFRGGGKRASPVIPCEEK